MTATNKGGQGPEAHGEGEAEEFFFHLVALPHRWKCHYTRGLGPGGQRNSQRSDCAVMVRLRDLQRELKS